MREQQNQLTHLGQLLFGKYFLCQNFILNPVVHFPFIFWAKKLLLVSLSLSTTDSFVWASHIWSWFLPVLSTARPTEAFKNLQQATKALLIT